jgi:hypothetical protein
MLMRAQYISQIPGGRASFGASCCLMADCKCKWRQNNMHLAPMGNIDDNEKTMFNK